MTTIKLKIAQFRKSKGIGQQELAEVLGISFQLVTKWDTDNRDNWNGKTDKLYKNSIETAVI